MNLIKTKLAWGEREQERMAEVNVFIKYITFLFTYNTSQLQKYIHISDQFVTLE